MRQGSVKSRVARCKAFGSSRVVVVVLGLFAGIAFGGYDGVARAADVASGGDLAAPAAGKTVAKRPGRSSDVSADAGRFVPWVVLANDGGKVWTPAVGSLGDVPILLLDESIARVHDRGWAIASDLSKGLSFDLTEGRDERSAQTVRGHLTKVAGQRDGSAVAIVESTHGITVQDVFTLAPDGGSWRKWLHFWSGADVRLSGAEIWRGHPLALVVDEAGYRFEVKAATATVVPPTPRPAAQASPSCRTAIRASRFVTTDSGAVVAVGPSCDRPEAVGLEVWAAGEGLGIVYLLPSGASVEVNALAARSVSEIHLGGCTAGPTRRPFIASLRDDKWEAEPPPSGTGCVQTVVPGNRRDLWAVIGDFERGRLVNARLWRRLAGKAWRPIDVPTPWAVPSEVIDIRVFDVDRADDIWVTVAPQSSSDRKKTAPDAYAILRWTPQR